MISLNCTMKLHPIQIQKAANERICFLILELWSTFLKVFRKRRRRRKFFKRFKVNLSSWNLLRKYESCSEFWFNQMTLGFLPSSFAFEKISWINDFCKRFMFIFHTSKCLMSKAWYNKYYMIYSNFAQCESLYWRGNLGLNLIFPGQYGKLDNFMSKMKLNIKSGF